MNNSLLLLSTIICSTLGCLVYWLCFASSDPVLDSVPGPLLARYSNIWRFIDSCTGRHHVTVLNLHREYGPVVRLGPKLLSVSDPAAVDEILEFKSNLNKSEQVKVMQNSYRGEAHPMLVSAIDARQHARLKRPIAGAYSMTTLLGFQDVADECITKMIQGIETEVANGDGSCFVDRWMHFLAFDFVGCSTFGRPFGFLDAEKDVDNMIKIIGWQSSYVSIIGTMPWLDYLLLKNPLLVALFEAPNPLVELTSKCIAERRSNSKEDPALKPKKDFLSYFMASQETHPDLVSDLHVAAYAATNVLAASETTASALTSTIWLILRHQNVKEKLQREIDAAGASFPVSFSDAQELPFLDAVIKESFRVFPTIGVLMERTVGPAGLTLSTGHSLRPGTSVGVSPWPVQRDKSIFGDNVDDFIPERWVQHQGETQEQYERRQSRMNRASIGFGWGPRGCLGKHVANLIIYKTLATLFSRFDVRIVWNPAISSEELTEMQMELVTKDIDPKVHAAVAVNIHDLGVYVKARHVGQYGL